MHDTQDVQTYTRRKHNARSLYMQDTQNTQSYTKDAELQSAGHVITPTWHSVTPTGHVVTHAGHVVTHAGRRVTKSRLAELQTHGEVQQRSARRVTAQCRQSYSAVTHSYSSAVHARVTAQCTQSYSPVYV